MSTLALAALTSCEKTETTTDPTVDPTTEATLAELVAGTYTGNLLLEVSLTSSSAVYADQTITLEYASDETVNISYSSDDWGSFAIEGASVSGSDPYSISGTGSVNYSGIELECTVEGSVNTTTGDVEFIISISSAGVTVTFTTESFPSLEVAGTYEGWTTLQLGDATPSEPITGEILTLVATGKNTVDITYESTQFGVISAEGVTVGDTNPYSVEGAGTLNLYELLGGDIDVDFTLTGTIDADTDEVTLNISTFFYFDVYVVFTNVESE